MTALAEELITEETSLTRIVERAQEGDRAAFGELFKRCQRAVYAVAIRRLGDHADAQELCQEVFVQALQKLNQLRSPAAFAGWLKSIADRMAINRAVRRRPVYTAEPDSLAAACLERETPVVKALARERRLQVRAGMARLGKTDRETLVAFYVNGRSLLEMSDQFRSPVGTIKRRLHVARKRLKKQLGEMAAV